MKIQTSNHKIQNKSKYQNLNTSLNLVFATLGFVLKFKLAIVMTSLGAMSSLTILIRVN